MNSITMIRTSAPPTPPAVTVLRVAGFSVEESILLQSVENTFFYSPALTITITINNAICWQWAGRKGVEDSSSGCSSNSGGG